MVSSSQQLFPTYHDTHTHTCEATALGPIIFENTFLTSRHKYIYDMGHCAWFADTMEELFVETIAFSKCGPPENAVLAEKSECARNAPVWPVRGRRVRRTLCVSRYACRLHAICVHTTRVAHCRSVEFPGHDEISCDGEISREIR